MCKGSLMRLSDGTDRRPNSGETVSNSVEPACPYSIARADAPTRVDLQLKDLPASSLTRYGLPTARFTQKNLKRV